MEDGEIIGEWMEEYQEEICAYCERHIINGRAISEFYQCDGRSCDDAFDAWFEAWK